MFGSAPDKIALNYKRVTDPRIPLVAITVTSFQFAIALLSWPVTSFQRHVLLMR